MFTQNVNCRLGVSIVVSKPWGGRFAAKTDRRIEEFTESISFDNRLFKQDVQGSIAHARMLARVGLLTEGECQQVVRTLLEIQAEIESGRFPFVLEREDVHMHIEAALVECFGGCRAQIALRAAEMTRLRRILSSGCGKHSIGSTGCLRELQTAFVRAADRYRDVIVPGYTHMQRAQPVLVAHCFLAYVEKLERDRLRLADCRKRLNVLPLGAAALAGSSLPIDRDFVACELGFDEVAANSLDASSDRDFVLESVFVLTMAAEHLAGWAEEWILWSTQEFGFLNLPDAICTGSSIMPQKKNPDVLELIRGRSARVVGALTTLLVLIKGLPLAYNRDLAGGQGAAF